jgi:hypothetical protein
VAATTIRRPRSTGVRRGVDPAVGVARSVAAPSTTPASGVGGGSKINEKALATSIAS